VKTPYFEAKVPENHPLTGSSFSPCVKLIRRNYKKVRKKFKEIPKESEKKGYSSSF